MVDDTEDTAELNVGEPEPDVGATTAQDQDQDQGENEARYDASGRELNPWEVLLEDDTESE